MHHLIRIKHHLASLAVVLLVSMVAGLFLPIALGQSAEDYVLSKRTIDQVSQESMRNEKQVRWDPKKTAVIVCDVWDYHHSINAVGRLEEMLPTMDRLLDHARKSGSTVIHSPSDCMPYYVQHPARLRAVEAPKSRLPANIASWNCKIAREDSGVYPLDQSDGGEDDDPEEHKQWAEKLKSLGRNPSLPWKAQHPTLSIDPNCDFISDRGDEVWSILQLKQIQHVIMIGVHTNMCVLGRPFGLRQLVSNRIDVVLVRDLTDCMYNPKRWPYVDHFTGNDMMIRYIEQHVCPTITSDQILGGKPVVFAKDTRSHKDVIGAELDRIDQRQPEWILTTWTKLIDSNSAPPSRNPLVRCSLRIPLDAFTDKVTISHPRIKKAWLNGNRLKLAENSSSLSSFQIEASETFENDDANVLVLEIDATQASQNPQVSGDDSSVHRSLPVVMSRLGAVTLSGSLQVKAIGTQADTNLPLPAKFALPPAVYYTLPDG